MFRVINFDLNKLFFLNISLNFLYSLKYILGLKSLFDYS